MKEEQYCWLFYLRSNELKRDKVHLDLKQDFTRGDLYAYALEKSIAKKFKKQRSDKYFRCKKVECDKRLLATLTDKFQGGIISERKVTTCIVGNTMGTIHVMMTDTEYHLMMSTVISYQFRPITMIGHINVNDFPDFRIFKEKYKNALQILHYDYFRLCLKGDLLLMDDDKLFRFDEFYVFLQLFGALMNDHEY